MRNYRYSLLSWIKRVKGTSLKSFLVQRAVGSLVIKIFYTLLTLITGIVLARVLKAEGFGHYTYAISWVTLLSFPAMMGLDKLLIREVARKKEHERWELLKGLLRWTDRTVLLSSMGIAASATAVVWALRQNLPPEGLYTLWTAFVIIPLLAFIRIRQGAIRGSGHIISSQIADFLVRPLLFLISIAILSINVDLSAPLAAGARAFCAAVALLGSVILARKYLTGRLKHVVPRFQSRYWIKSGMTFLTAGTAAIFIERISVILAGTLIGAEATGHYEVARKGATLITFLASAVAMTIGPTVARLYTNNEKARLDRLIGKSVLWNTLTAVILAVFFIILGKWFLILFGEEFVAAQNILIILSIGAVCQTALGPTSLLLNMTGYERYTAAVVGAAVFTSILLAIVFVPLWGVEGVAMAELLSLVAYKSISAVIVRKKIGITPCITLGRRTPAGNNLY